MDDPIYRALLARLPAAGSEWAMFQRVRWLRAFAAMLDLDYVQADCDLAEDDPHIDEE